VDACPTLCSDIFIVYGNLHCVKGLHAADHNTHAVLLQGITQQTAVLPDSKAVTVAMAYHKLISVAVIVVDAIDIMVK